MTKVLRANEYDSYVLNLTYNMYFFNISTYVIQEK